MKCVEISTLNARLSLAFSQCRLELTVDQSWPPSVLASLGQLERLRNLSVLKLDCGRQQPVEPMWEGESMLLQQ